MNTKKLFTERRTVTFVVLVAIMLFTGCSKSPDMAKLAAKLFDRYHEHFLDVRQKKEQRLVVYYQMNFKKYTDEQLHEKAREVARFTYDNYDNPIGVRNIEVYIQTIGAPTRINEPDAKDYVFSTDDLGD